MCFPSAAVAGVVVSAIGSAASIYQGMQNMNLTVASAKQNQDLSYRQSQQQQNFQNQAIVQKHIGDVRAQQAAQDAANMAFYYGDQAANAAYVSQQEKLNEVKTKAAFKSQEIYAKAIGAKGKILSSGLTGQSVGLLALNEERRQGFALAEQNATIRSAEMAMGNSNEETRLKALSNINTIASRVPSPVSTPTLSPQPIGIGKDLGLGIPSYNWGTA